MPGKKFNVLPGFGLTLGFTMFYLSVIVLIPLGGLFFRVSEVGWKSQNFSESDFKNAEALADALKEHSDPAAQLIWERLPEPVQQKLTNSAPETVNEAELVQTLTAGLNHILHGGSLYDEKRFAEAKLPLDTLPVEAQRLITRRPEGRALVRLNRLLIESANPGWLNHRESWYDFWRLATSSRAMAAYRLTFGASLLAALANMVFGTLLAWVLVRYEFPGRRFIDAIVDFPFALPTAVAGLTLANLFSANGWLGRFLVPLGIEGAYSRLGIVIALTFVGMPFVVRTLQPVLESLEHELEEAAATLGASRLRTFVSVIAPTLMPAIITGFALAFARAIGEYGSIVFISSNQANQTEIAPYLIVIRLEEYDFTGAIALAVVLLVISFVLLAGINLLEQWSRRFQP
jgi:sulfate/thiosulfate transport system permease protein